MKRMDVMHRLGSLSGLATVVTLAASTSVSAQPAPVKVAPASAEGYSVVLVLGDVQNAAAGDNNVPPAARKALGDMKDFLPYKSYRLLDAQWILGSQRTVSRLRGANDQEYELTLRGVAIAGGKLSVNFRLAEPGPIVGVRPAADADSRAGRRASLEDALRAAEAEAERLRTSSGQKRGEAIAATREKIAAIQKELEQEKSLRDAAARVGGRSIIDTNFMMDVGETVVVGTSRVAGDKALIALLTAVAHAGR